jgi:hypothetical protein
LTDIDRALRQLFAGRAGCANQTRDGTVRPEDADAGGMEMASHGGRHPHERFGFILELV